MNAADSPTATDLVPAVVLAGRTLVLEPLEPAHTAPLIEAALAGRSMFEQLRTSELATETDVRRWATEQMRHSRADHDVPWVVTDARTGGAVGCVWVADIRPAHARCKLGQLWFAPDAAQDTAMEALLVAIDHVFAGQKIDRIGMHAALDHPEADELLRTLGATREGVLRDWLHRSGGERMDVAVYSLLAGEYPVVVDLAWDTVGGRPSDAEQRDALAMLEAARGTTVDLPLPRPS